MPLACVKSPKSIAFPADAIVIYSISSPTLGDIPPPHKPRVEEEQIPLTLRADDLQIQPHFRD